MICLHRGLESKHSLNPVGTNGGWGMVTFGIYNFAMGLFVCFVLRERRIMILAGHLAGAVGINPVGSMVVLYTVCLFN